MSAQVGASAAAGAAAGAQINFDLINEEIASTTPTQLRGGWDQPGSSGSPH
jgi:hypothetical protein